MSDEPKLPLKKLLEVDAQIDQQAREYVEQSEKLRSY